VEGLVCDGRWASGWRLSGVDSSAREKLGDVEGMDEQVWQGVMKWARSIS
jgi:hypothetical protein